MYLTQELSQLDRFDAQWQAIERREQKTLKELKTLATVRLVLLPVLQLKELTYPTPGYQAAYKPQEYHLPSCFNRSSIASISAISFSCDWIICSDNFLTSGSLMSAYLLTMIAEE